MLRGKNLPAILAAAALVALLGTGVDDAAARVYIQPAPPPVVVETRPAPPGRHYVWMGGYYQWNGRGYVWVPGHWARPPYHRVAWVPGRWRHTPHGWYWVPGHWR